jgi:protein-tyrosine-phosphatase
MRQSLPFLKLLAHTLRWNLLTLLARSDYRVQELVHLVEEPQNLVSYHLKRLRKAHLVVERRSNADARDIYYSLDVERLQNLFLETGASLHPVLGHPAKVLHDRSHRILFLCTENSARSQLAEGIMRHLANNVEVFSAGSVPTEVHPLAIEAARERGIDLSAHESKHMDEFIDTRFDYVITVCDLARETCPGFPGSAEYIHWSLPDPSLTNDYAAFQQTAAEIEKRVRYLIPKLGGV